MLGGRFGSCHVDWFRFGRLRFGSQRNDERDSTLTAAYRLATDMVRHAQDRTAG